MMVYHASSLVVLASQSDPHRQTLLRGHSAEVVCLAQVRPAHPARAAAPRCEEGGGSGEDGWERKERAWARTRGGARAA